MELYEIIILCSRTHAVDHVHTHMLKNTRLEEQLVGPDQALQTVKVKSSALLRLYVEGTAQSALPLL